MLLNYGFVWKCLDISCVERQCLNVYYINCGFHNISKIISIAVLAEIDLDIPVITGSNFSP
jgi:hypothetical protein